MTLGQKRDVNLRKALAEDFNNARRNLMKLNELISTKDDLELVDILQRLLIDLRNLDKKVSLTPVGDTYKLGWIPTKEAEINQKLRNYDRALMSKSSVLAKATSTLNHRYLEGAVENVSRELNKIRMYVNDLQNELEHREDIVKGVR